MSQMQPTQKSPLEEHLAADHLDGEVCEKCCEHEFDANEGYACIHCGMDGFEAMVCAAEDYGSDR
jgi:hypothetical protein